MVRRSLPVLVLAAVFGLVFATLFDFPAARSDEAPSELKKHPEHASARSKDLSRPFIRATRRVRPAVVRIHNMRRYRNRWAAASGGSGFIISKQGHVLTNKHVIENADALIVELKDGRVFRKVKMLGADPRSDVAVLRLEDVKDPLPVATLGDSDELEVGEWVIAIGSPFQLSSSVSVGVVSATGRTGVVQRGVRNSEEFIQTDAALNPGNSGGPLINLDGQVVGINTAIQTGGRSQSSAGVGFAIPVNLARTIAIALIERGIARRGWLGIGLYTVEQTQRTYVYSRAQLREAGITAQAALRVSVVEPGSPAEVAGIKPKDYLTAIDGRPLTSDAILFARLAQAGPGGKVTITVNGSRDVVVRLAEERLETYGLEVGNLDASRAAELGLPAGTAGVVVLNVVPDSVAGRADTRNRLMPGDVITRIQWRGGEAVVRNKRDFDKCMANLSSERPRLIRFIFRTKDGDYRADLRP